MWQEMGKDHQIRRIRFLIGEVYSIEEYDEYGQ